MTKRDKLLVNAHDIAMANVAFEVLQVVVDMLVKKGGSLTPSFGSCGKKWPGGAMRSSRPATRYARISTPRVQKSQQC
jgi:hypothetical protein